MQAFAFQPVRHESGIFRFECMKACLRHDLSRHVRGISVTRNIKSRPSPMMSSDQMPRPRED